MTWLVWLLKITKPILAFCKFSIALLPQLKIRACTLGFKSHSQNQVFSPISMSSNLDCNSQLFLPLWIECSVFIDPMASFQSSLTSFLFEGRLFEEDIVSDPILPNKHGEAINIANEIFQIPITDVVANFVGSNAPKPLSLLRALKVIAFC